MVKKQQHSHHEHYTTMWKHAMIAYATRCVTSYPSTMYIDNELKRIRLVVEQTTILNDNLPKCFTQVICSSQIITQKTIFVYLRRIVLRA